MTPSQIDALRVLLSAKSTAWTRANGDTFPVSTGDALVRMGYATTRALPRTSRGCDSAYRITGRGIIAARKVA